MDEERKRKMKRRDFDEFYEKNYDRAIDNLRDKYEPDEDLIVDELTDMWEAEYDEYCDRAYDEERDSRLERE